MDTQQHGVGNSVHQRRSVADVGNLPLPHGVKAGIADHAILPAGHLRGDACKAQQLFQSQGNRQIDPTLLRTVRRYGTAVLPAVARIDHHRL